MGETNVGADWHRCDKCRGVGYIEADRDQPPEGAVRGHTKVTLITDGQHYISPGYDGEGREGRTYWYVEALILGATDELDRENARAAHHAWTENAALRAQPPEDSMKEAARRYAKEQNEKAEQERLEGMRAEYEERFDRPAPATDRGENDG